MGGEELILAVPFLNENDAIKLGEEFRGAVVKREIGKREGGLTCSYGLFVYDESNEKMEKLTADEMIELANVAVTLAKGKGKASDCVRGDFKNRVVLWQKGMPTTVEELKIEK